MKKLIGTVSFVGNASFAEGTWYGVTLDDPLGKNDGSVQGKSYFHCDQNCGLFVRIQQLIAFSSQASSSSTPQNGIMQIQSQKTPNVPRGISQIQPPKCVTPTGNRPPSVGLMAPRPSYNIGDKVIVGGKKGVVRYIGPTQFAKGMWTGVELDSPGGKNNGNVEGIKYFTCAPKHGLFAPISKVMPIPISIPNLQTTPQQLQHKKTPSTNSTVSSNSSLRYVSANSRERPSSRNSSSSLSSSGKSKRGDADMDLEGQISGLRNKLEEVSSENSILEDKLAEEKNMREDLQFSLDEQTLSLESDGPRTPGIFREKKQEVELLQGTIRKLEQGLAQAYAQHNTASSEIEELRDSLDRERKYSVELEKERDRLNKIAAASDQEGGISSVEESDDKKGELEMVRQENKELLRSLSQRQNELDEEVSAKQAVEEKLKKLEKKLGEQAGQLEALESEYRIAMTSLESEKRNSLTEMNSVVDQKRSLEESVSSLKSDLETVKEELEGKSSQLTSLNRHLSSKDSQIEDIQSQFQEAQENFHFEREGLQAPVTELQDRNSSLEKELARVKKELRESKSLHTQDNSYEVKCAELETCLKKSDEERDRAKESLLRKEEECYSLQEQLNTASVKFKQRDEECKEQHLMIRELEESNQRKLGRITTLESYMHTNGEAQKVETGNEDPLMAQDFNLDVLSELNIDTPPEDSILDSPLNWIQPPSRLYCDICEKFDSHETEDCPIQNDTSEEFQTPIMVSTYSERPYCAICEIFGHTTDDCDSQVTF